MANKVMPTRGMRDFLPAEKAQRERILNVLRETYTSLGFFEIETPVMEPIERLKSGQGGENESMIFEVQRRGLDRAEAILPRDAVDLGMRYDLTLPLSRYYATHAAELPTVFRAFQTGPVWRAERPQKGRYRQFNQCDIDIIGSDSYVCEVEVLSTAWHVMERLNLADQAVIMINDRRLLAQMLSAVGIAAKNHAGALITLDKIDKIGADAVVEELVKFEYADEAQGRALLGLVDYLQGLELVNVEGEVHVADDKLGELAINLYDLPQIANDLLALNPSIKIVFTPNLVRGMGYYTGPIFEVRHEGFGSSICGGGRYDGVIGRWLGKDVPAVGFSFGFERIVELVRLEEGARAARVALAYQKDPEALAALRVRELLCGKAEAVGLVKAPRKMGGGFFEELQSLGYDRVLLPSQFMQLQADFNTTDLDTLADGLLAAAKSLA